MMTSTAANPSEEAWTPWRPRLWWGQGERSRVTWGSQAASEGGKAAQLRCLVSEGWPDWMEKRVRNQWDVF